MKCSVMFLYIGFLVLGLSAAVSSYDSSLADIEDNIKEAAEEVEEAIEEVSNDNDDDDSDSNDGNDNDGNDDRRKREVAQQLRELVYKKVNVMESINQQELVESRYQWRTVDEDLADCLGVINDPSSDRRGKSDDLIQEI